jgi:hypothetical protein
MREEIIQDRRVGNIGLEISEMGFAESKISGNE